jgi:cell wall-associated NlpC family hydrolase
MGRLALVVGFSALLALAPAQLAAKPPPPGGTGSWADAQIQTVVAAGLMAPSAAEFRPDDPLTSGELAELVAALAGNAAIPIPADPAAPVALADLDAALVQHLGLGPTAKAFRSALAAAGLEPAKRAGTAIVSKALKLHPNHTPETQELTPSSPVSRAETAYAVARVLALPDSWELGDVQTKAAAFALPELGDWQRRILTRAVSLLGYPYVWAGASENGQMLGSGQAPGGFDCSGFVWRVYKLEPYPDAPQLAATLEGRTTYAMSGEVGPALRVARDALLPADVLFFGDRGPKSKPAQIGHMGIYLGNGWFVHSSSGGAGVMLSTLTGYYEERFAWARRPLAEAGLS